jgi:hypothetical protein
MISHLFSNGEMYERFAAFMLSAIVEIITSPFFFSAKPTFGDMSPTASLFIQLSLFCIVFILPTALAPARGLIKRITFLLIGIAFIGALSELSKLAAYLQYAAQSLPPS